MSTERDRQKGTETGSKDVRTHAAVLVAPLSADDALEAMLEVAAAALEDLLEAAEETLDETDEALETREAATVCELEMQCPYRTVTSAAHRQQTRLQPRW
jgi:hypothetical protein